MPNNIEFEEITKLIEGIDNDLKDDAVTLEDIKNIIQMIDKSEYSIRQVKEAINYVNALSSSQTKTTTKSDSDHIYYCANNINTINLKGYNLSQYDDRNNSVSNI